MEKHHFRIESSSPFRVDLTGGFTDIPELCPDEEVIHINCTIDRFAICRFSEIQSLPQKTSLYWRIVGESAVKYLGLSRLLPFSIHSTGPIGSGLGSSSAAVVAVLAALAKIHNLDISRNKLARLAIEVEREAGTICGSQDQYATVYGGINIWLLRSDEIVVVKPVDAISELQRRTILVHLGHFRQSSYIIARIIDRFRRGDHSTVEVLNELKETAKNLADILFQCDYEHLPELISEVGELQFKLDDQIIPDEIRYLNPGWCRSKGLGVKATGAGGMGACYLIVCDPDQKQHIIQWLMGRGFQVLPISFVQQGVQVSTGLS